MASEATSVEEEGDASHSATMRPTSTILTPASPASSTATNRVLIQAFAGQLPKGMDTREYMSSSAGPKHSPKQKQEESREKASKAPYQCRQCGHSSRGNGDMWYRGPYNRIKSRYRESFLYLNLTNASCHLTKSRGYCSLS